MPDEREPRRLFVCDAADLQPGGRALVTVDGLSIGVFNVRGRHYALHNRCPHAGGALCEGPITGTAAATPDFRYAYEREGEILRCAWHGWEFEVETGRSLVDPRIRARTYPVEVVDGRLYVLV
ncbi:MAG: Rieske (2Fe-2S) protein [Actinomycetota bacterium]|jgi:nitrite reductase/ring-hydroxylating ferredoxin subunit|nr:Rieske (2Fe-2S) protein [Actinomycetota bacterium]